MKLVQLIAILYGISWRGVLEGGGVWNEYVESNWMALSDVNVRVYQLDQQGCGFELNI